MLVGDVESDGAFRDTRTRGFLGGEDTLTTAFPFPSPAASLSAGIYGGAEEQL